MEGKLDFSGNLGIKVIRAKSPGIWWFVRNWFHWNKIKSLFGVFVVIPIARMFGLMTAYGKLEAVLIRADGTRVRYGVLGYRVITTAFVDFVVDQLQTETSVFGDYKYHDSGVGNTAENITDTTIQTTDGEARATGTQTESSHNVYASVGTIAYTTTKAIVEHGLFNDVTAGTLMDRTVFTVINVVSGDSIQFTYSLTLTPGS